MFGTVLNPELLMGHKYYVDGEFERRAEIHPVDIDWSEPPKLPPQPNYTWQPFYGEVVSVSWDMEAQDVGYYQNQYVMTKCKVDIVSDLSGRLMTVDVRQLTNHKPKMRT